MSNQWVPNQGASSSSDIRSGALVPENHSPKKVQDTTPAVFSDGRSTTLQMSASVARAHPQHIPTGTTEVLTFYPTLEEFRDFKGYIDKVEKANAHTKCGIAKIVPPEGWHPRPSRKNNYKDLEDFKMNSPVVEEIKGAGGVYYKRNHVYQRKMTAKEYRRLANSVQYKNPEPGLTGSALEKQFFDNIGKEPQPIYGADTEGSIYDPDVKEFNMNHLETILDETKSEKKISGVNTVYLYFGMYRTTFPWHSEDMDLFSINYLHFGAPKYWFAIPPDSAERFERLMSQKFPGDEDHCKAFLRHKSYIIDTSTLHDHNIPYGTMIQRPNEFIITFPKGYHMGFNTGYNLAESTNFATDRWIDYGKNAILCKCMRNTVEINMIPYMIKYRPEEFESWNAYWYGGRVNPVEEPKKKLTNKKQALANKRKTNVSIALPKRARLGADETGSGGSISDGSFECSSNSSPDIKNAGSLFASSLNPAIQYDFSEAIELSTDFENLIKNFKRVTKDLMSKNINLFAERQCNEINGKYWPHCDVCSHFQPHHARPRCSEIPKKSCRLLNAEHFLKKEIKEEEKEIITNIEDILLTCDNCHVTVHSSCYSAEIANEESPWECFRCRNHTDIEIRSASCSLCELRGGALIPCQIGTDQTYVHVICALMNRRTAFDRSIGPTMAHVIPPPKQNVPVQLIPQLNKDYLIEFGEKYEHSRWECFVCKKSREGLIICTLCFDETEDEDSEKPKVLGKYPTTAHSTCARAAGFHFEKRQFPRGLAMICHKHGTDYLIDKVPSGYINIKCSDEVFAPSDGEGKYEKAIVVEISRKPTLVVDYYDRSVSRDLFPEDIVSCECVDCDGLNHQNGIRLRVKWDDGLIYDGYFRGLGHVLEYLVRFPSGQQLRFLRSKIMSKREMANAKKCVKMETV